MHDKKLSILAFCALLKLERERIPAELLDGWVGIVGGILKLLDEFPKAVERGCISVCENGCLMLGLDREKLAEEFDEDDFELDDEETHLNMADDGKYGRLRLCISDGLARRGRPG